MILSYFIKITLKCEELPPPPPTFRLDKFVWGCKREDPEFIIIDRFPKAFFLSTSYCLSSLAMASLMGAFPTSACITSSWAILQSNGVVGVGSLFATWINIYMDGANRLKLIWSFSAIFILMFLNIFSLKKLRFFPLCNLDYLILRNS